MKTLFAIAFVIMCTSAFSQAPSKPVGKVIIDNETVKVTSLESNPGKDMCGLGKHSHGAHLTVLLTDANITITTPDGKVITRKAPAGTTFWSEAETHTVINSGTSVIKAEMIEYKTKK